MPDKWRYGSFLPIETQFLIPLPRQCDIRDSKINVKIPNHLSAGIMWFKFLTQLFVGTTGLIQMDSSKQRIGALASKSPYNRTQGRTTDWHKALSITQTLPASSHLRASLSDSTTMCAFSVPPDCSRTSCSLKSDADRANTNVLGWLEPRSLCASCGFGSDFSPDLTEHLQFLTTRFIGTKASSPDLLGFTTAEISALLCIQRRD